MNELASRIFLNGIKDTKGLYHVVDQLEALSKELYHNKEGTITQKLSGKLLSSLQAIFTYLEQNNLEPSGDSEQKAFIEDIVERLKKVRQAKVTLAFEPDSLFISKLNDEISAAAGQKVILDVSVNPRIVGGLVLEYQGKHKNYSIEPRVNEYLKTQLPLMLKKEAI